jgi:PAS domain-containing protein
LVDRLIEETFSTFVFSALESSVAHYESWEKGMAPWSQLVENSLARICIDQDGKIAFANKIFVEIHGY